MSELKTTHSLVFIYEWFQKKTHSIVFIHEWVKKKLNSGWGKNSVLSEKKLTVRYFWVMLRGENIELSFFSSYDSKFPSSWVSLNKMPHIQTHLEWVFLYFCTINEWDEWSKTQPKTHSLKQKTQTLSNPWSIPKLNCI